MPIIYRIFAIVPAGFLTLHAAQAQSQKSPTVIFGSGKHSFTPTKQQAEDSGWDNGPDWTADDNLPQLDQASLADPNKDMLLKKGPSEGVEPPVTIPQPKQPDKAKNKDASKIWAPRWRDQVDPITKLFDRFSDNKSKKVLQTCLKNLTLTLRYSELAAQRREALAKKWSEKTYLNERYYWQVRDRVVRQRKKLHSMKKKAASDMATRLVRIIRDLDAVKHREIRQSAEFARVQAHVFREYVKAQMFLNNFGQSIPILEKYIGMNEKNFRDPKAREYLVACYEHQEKASRKQGGNHDAIRFFQRKKHENMRAYAILKYGSGSEEFREIMETIERERMTSGLF